MTSVFNAKFVRGVFNTGTIGVLVVARSAIIDGVCWE